MNNKGLRPYSISCQNEPQNSDNSYPTMLLPASQEALVGKALRSLLDSNGFSDVKLIGYDHNWDNAGTYPIQLVCIYYSRRRLSGSYHPRCNRQVQHSRELRSTATQEMYPHKAPSRVPIPTRKVSNRAQFTELRCSISLKLALQFTLPSVQAPWVLTGGATLNGTCITCLLEAQTTTLALSSYGTSLLMLMDLLVYLEQIHVPQAADLLFLWIIMPGISTKNVSGLHLHAA